MSADAENQQVDLALMAEEGKVPATTAKKSSKSREPRRNFCTEKYLVRIGVPLVVVILVIVFIALAMLYVRRYNRNCSHTKGTSCRGSLWYFN